MNEMMAARYVVRFYDSEEQIPAPSGMSEEQAARWALRLYHPSVVRIQRGGDNMWIGDNGRRGSARRVVVVYVEVSRHLGTEGQ